MIDPVELERLSKAATQGLDHAAIYKEARARTLRDMTGQDFDFHHIQVIAEHVMRSAIRTGQLVPAQPSADEDAARYRWLRDHSVPPHNFYISVPDEFHGVKYGTDEVDAYIDAARAALGEKP